MRYERLLALGTLLAASPLASQQNPFALTSPSVKSAYIVYEMSTKGTKVPGARMELGVTRSNWVMRMVSPFEIAGKRDTMRGLGVAVPLRWSDKNGTTMVATKVVLNGPMPPALGVLPKGVKWKQDEGFEGGDFAMNIWSYKHPEATDMPTAAQVGGFAVKYLATPAAAAELREMGGGAGGEEAEDEAEE